MCYKHKAGRNICIARKNRTLQDSPVLKVLWRITETFLPPKAYRAGTHNTETKVVVAVVRVVVVPIRHGTVRSIVVPRATAFDAVRTGRRAGHHLVYSDCLFIFLCDRARGAENTKPNLLHRLYVPL